MPPKGSVTAREHVGTMPADSLEAIRMGRKVYRFTDGWKARWLDGGKVTGDTYNMFGAMHGTIMVFLGIVPLAVGGFGNYILPLQVGAPDMTFPRVNMASYWCSFSLKMHRRWQPSSKATLSSMRRLRR